MEQLLNNTPINWVQVTDPKTGRIYYAPAPSIYPEKGLEGNTDISDINVTNTLITASLIPGFSDTPSSIEFTKGDNSTFSILLDITPASSSYALTASYVETAQTASYVLNAISSSYALTASYAVSSSHEIIKEVSSSYADTASFAQSGDGIFSGSFSGSFEGIANTSSYALTASYVETAQTASYVLQAISASYATQALSASWAPGGAGTPTFPYTGSAIISGSLELTGSLFVQDINGKTNIDSLNRQLYDAGPIFPPEASAVLSVDWVSRQLFNASSVLSVAWADHLLYDTTGILSGDYHRRKLITDSGTGNALIWDDSTYLDSEVYQRDYKSAVTQEAVSTNSTAYLGDVIESDGSATVIDAAATEGMLVYLDGSTWYPVNQAAITAANLLGIAHNLASIDPPPPFGPIPQTGLILLEGHVVIDDTATTGPYVAGAAFGMPIYIEDNTTTGTMSTTVPTTTGGPNVVRVLGHCYQQNTTTTTQWMMKFRPSNDWVEI
jgi:hypothetical protein